jgi:hypothetical protein
VRPRLLLHAALLLGVLLAGFAFVGVDGLVSADEGAMVAELDVLERTGEWTLSNPEPAIDPDMRRLPLELSERSAEGRWAPFAKHPVHIVALLPAWELGGLAAVLVMSLLGVGVAAACAGLLAERLRPGSGPLALWLTGVGSPLLFDGFQVVGHAVGAGLFGVAAVAAVGTSGTATRGRAARAALVLVVPAAVAATALVRSEGVLAGLALAVGFGVSGVLRRQWATVAAAGGAAVAAAAVRIGEPRLREGALGGQALSTTGLGGEASSGGLAGRVRGFRTTVLEPGYSIDGGEGLLLVALVLVVAAGLVWRRRRDERLAAILLGVAAVAAVGRMVSSDFLVPGLLPAMPALALALVLVERRHVVEEVRPALWATAALFVGGVLATQYESGGGGEWGGRYFAIGLPVLVALVAVVLLDAFATVPDATRRVTAIAGAAIVVSIAAGAIHATAQAKDGSDRAAETVVARLDELEVDATVSARPAIARFAWDDVLDGRRWLTTSTGDVPAVLGALAGTDADRIAVLASRGADLDAMIPAEGGWRVEGTDVLGGVVVALVTR